MTKKTARNVPAEKVHNAMELGKILSDTLKTNIQMFDDGLVCPREFYNTIVSALLTSDHCFKKSGCACDSFGKDEGCAKLVNCPIDITLNEVKSNG